jgi:hypothetical protein
MRIYKIVINGQVTTQKASRASVAVKRALDRFTDSEVDRATISIIRGDVIRYAYRVIAEVPCEPEGSFKRENISGLMSESEAKAAIYAHRAAHPEYRYVRSNRIEL